jgi:hypothetical protein
MLTGSSRGIRIRTQSAAARVQHYPVKCAHLIFPLLSMSMVVCPMERASSGMPSEVVLLPAELLPLVLLPPLLCD